MSLQRPEDWYQVELNDMADRSANGLVTGMYGGSLVSALVRLYPEFEWKLWRFGKTPNNFWTKHSNVVQYLQWLADELNILQVEDWYRVTLDQLVERKGAMLYRKYKGIIPILAAHLPEHHWNMKGHNMKKNNALHSGGQNQKVLVTTIKKIFPSLEVKVNYQHADLVFSSAVRMELDVYVPSVCLAFEYQGLRKSCPLTLLRRTALQMALHVWCTCKATTKRF
jgi:hypothetical protein